jgi:hypothetical protein
MRPHAPEWFQLDLFPPGKGDGRRSSDAERRPGSRGVARWAAQLRCYSLGHVWRESHSRPGLQTCERCRRRRLPMH